MLYNESQQKHKEHTYSVWVGEYFSLIQYYEKYYIEEEALWVDEEILTYRISCSDAFVLYLCGCDIKHNSNLEMFKTTASNGIAELEEKKYMLAALFREYGPDFINKLENTAITKELIAMKLLEL